MPLKSTLSQLHRSALLCCRLQSGFQNTVLAVILRFIHNCKATKQAPHQHISGPLSVSELEEAAEELLLRCTGNNNTFTPGADLGI